MTPVRTQYLIGVCLALLSRIIEAYLCCICHFVYYNVMSESVYEVSGLSRHINTLDVRFTQFAVGVRKCQIIYGRINEV